jgi:D-alanyl-lipoteichoic acid acyltransferase DltB (MBOAT superfamily)
MLFTDPKFFLFAGIFFVLYFLAPARFRTAITVAGSLAFYSVWDWRFAGLLTFTILNGWFSARAIASSDDPRRRKMVLVAFVAVSLIILGWFKYFNFFAASFASLMGGASWTTINIVLPVGISFYTFHTMSYVIDVWRKKMEPEPRLLQFAEFVAIWPVLVAGPIIRASNLLPQLRRQRDFSWSNLVSGTELIILGFFLKMVLADNLAPVVGAVYGSPNVFSSQANLIATLFFAFQIYGDFAGYSYIAIGFGRLLGVNFGSNFRRPYFSTDFSDFWRRWHISLSSWLRDYLYIALGGNRHGVIRTYFNLAATMVLGGLWHGANWTFVVWGALHGLYLIVQRLGTPAYRAVKKATRAPAFVLLPLRMLAVFAFVTLAWVFFRASSVGEALQILARIFAGAGQRGGEVVRAYELIRGFALIGAVVAVEAVLSTPQGSRWRRLAFKRPVRWIAAAAMLLAIAALGVTEGAQFIYFAF